MGRDNHAYNGSRSSERNIQTIEERTACSTLRVGALLIWRLLQTRLDRWQVEQGVISATHDHTESREKDIRQRSWIAIEPIQTNQDEGYGGQTAALRSR